MCYNLKVNKIRKERNQIDEHAEPDETGTKDAKADGIKTG